MVEICVKKIKNIFKNFILHFVLIIIYKKHKKKLEQKNIKIFLKNARKAV